MTIPHGAMDPRRGISRRISIMAIMDTKKIRNIVLLGHGGCGKTSLAEAMLYISGGTDRLGKIADGNTVCDYDSEEVSRGFSLSLSC